MIFCKIVLPVSGFFLVFLYYFDCVGPMLPRHYANIGGTNDVYATALMRQGICTKR